MGSKASESGLNLVSDSKSTTLLNSFIGLFKVSEIGFFRLFRPAHLPMWILNCSSNSLNRLNQESSWTRGMREIMKKHLLELLNIPENPLVIRTPCLSLTYQKLDSFLEHNHMGGS